MKFIIFCFLAFYPVMLLGAALWSLHKADYQAAHVHFIAGVAMGAIQALAFSLIYFQTK